MEFSLERRDRRREIVRRKRRYPCFQKKMNLNQMMKGISICHHSLALRMELLLKFSTMSHL